MCYAYVLGYEERTIPPAAGNKVTERYVHSKSFSVQLAVKCEWEGGFQPNGNGLISLQSTQTKMTALGWGVRIWHQTALHFSPGQHTMVFQGEVFDFKVYAMETTDNGYKNKNMCIL